MFFSLLFLLLDPSLPSDLAVITSEESSLMLNPKETPSIIYQIILLKMSWNNRHLNFSLFICLFCVSPQGSRNVVHLLRHHSLSPWRTAWHTAAHRRCSINIWRINALAFKIRKLFTRWWPSSFSWWDSKHLLVSKKWVFLLRSHLLQVCFGHTEAVCPLARREGTLYFQNFTWWKKEM